MSSRLLLVDYSNLFYRAGNVHRDLSWKGKFTGALYGFAVGLASLVDKTSATRVIVCKDEKPYARSEDYPKYKMNRPGNDDQERLEQLRMNQQAVDELLMILRCQAISRKGFEADDLMAVLAQRCEYDYDSIVIASNDSDLYQLLGQSNLSLYLGKKGFYDSRRFFNDYPKMVRCDQWPEVAAIAGGHNNTPGIRGIGPKTAMAIVTDNAIKEKHRARLDEHKRQIRLNQHLCRLPYPRLKERHHEIMIRSRGSFEQYNERHVTHFLTRFGIKMTMSMAYSFEAIARGNDAF